MPVANLFNVPSNSFDLLDFSFHNQNEHIAIVNLVRQKRGLVLPLYLLDPIPEDDPEEFLRIHQQAHNDFTSALGIFGVDLTDVDFQKPEQLASWITLHGEEHRQAAQILGIG